MPSPSAALSRLRPEPVAFGSATVLQPYFENAASPEVLADPLTEALDAQLDDGYELVATSPQGLAELYRRRP